MVKEKRVSVLAIIIFIMSAVVLAEFVVIIRNIFMIKRENVYLKNQVNNLVQTNGELEEKYKEIMNKLENYIEPKNNPPGIPNGWKVYRYFDYGFQIAYPGEYKIKANIQTQDGGRGLKIYSDDQSVFLDVKAIKLDKFRDEKEYVIGTYEYKVYPKNKVIINNQELELYKLQGNKHYYIFLKTVSHIIEVNSPSEEFLIEVVKTIKYI